MRRVAIFKSLLLPYSTTFIREQARSLRRWQPVLLGVERPPGGLSLEGFEVRMLSNRGTGRLARLGRSLCDGFRLPYPSWVAALRETGCSLIHAHFGTDAVAIWPAVRASRLPMLVTLHGYDINIRREWWETGHGESDRRDYPRRLLAMARHPRVRFIAVSCALRERAIELGIPEEKILVRYTGIDTTVFRPGGVPITRRPQRILFTGRLVEKKGVAYLIRAFSTLLRHVPPAELVIAGDGPLRAELERLAAELRVPARFLGALTHEQVRLQMERAAVLCVPSVTASNGDAEGLPTVVLEAQACGLPVITSARGANEAVVDSATGYTFPERDSERLRKLLLSLLRDPDRLSQMSELARRHAVQHFALDSCTDMLEDIYDRITESAR